MSAKVRLIASRLLDNPFCAPHVRPVAECLPYFQPEGDGYVHVAREMTMHYDNKTGQLRHTAVGFWCGPSGFLYPADVQFRGKGGRRRAAMVATPAPGRVVCATCQGRAVGAGQIADAKIAGNFVAFRPHRPFLAVRARVAAEVRA